MPRQKPTKKPDQRPLPTLRLHRQSGRCYATFNGQKHWFGSEDDPQTAVRFDTHLARWLANGRRPEESRDQLAGLTVSSVAARYLRHLEEMHDERWHQNNGARVRLSLKPLLELFGTELAAEFRPKRLKAVRHAMINTDRLCRSEINARVQILRKVFRWAASEELIPASVSHGLDAVEHLQRGQYGVKEGRTRTAVPEDVVFATIEYLHPVAAALVELLWWTGARPSEIFGLCPQDIDREGNVWIARLREHKTARKGKTRELDFGPKAQRILRRYLDRVPPPAPDKPIFHPALAMAEHNHQRRKARKSKVWPSHRDRYERERARRQPIQHADRYTASALRTAIARAVKRANRDRAAAGEDENGKPKLAPLPEWTPYMLRHSALTRIRAALGLEAAKAVGGHSSVVMTEGYSQMAERELARQTAAELG